MPEGKEEKKRKEKKRKEKKKVRGARLAL